MKFEKLKSAKMSEAVANQIIKLVKEGSLKPGDKLPTENELVESLGVSRTAIREGMQRLLMINLIEIRPGSGTFICNLPTDGIMNKVLKKGIIEDRKTLLEIIEIRKIFEIGIIGLAISKITENDLKKLGHCIEMHEKGLLQNAFPAKGDIEFHNILAMCTHNKLLMNVFSDIYTLILNSVTGNKNYKINYKEALKFHKEIFNALKLKDENLAKDAMSRHLNWLRDMFSK